MDRFFIGLSLLALLLFWAVGAHNRLVRLRAAVARAWEPFDQCLQRCLAWLRDDSAQWLSAEHLEPDLEAWTRVQAAGAQLALALARTRAQPGDQAAIESLELARGALDRAWIDALAPQAPTDAGPPSGRDRLVAKWLEWKHQELPLAGVFNDAVGHYNAAIGQFPARWLARVFGLRAMALVSMPGAPGASADDPLGH